MSPEPAVEWTQETNSSFFIVIGDALIKWTGACWRVITVGSLMGRLQWFTIVVRHIHCTARALWHHMLHLDSLDCLVGTALIPISDYTHTQWTVRACARCSENSLLAWEKGKKLFNRGVHGGKAIFNNVFFLQQQFCSTHWVQLPTICHPTFSCIASLHVLTYISNGNKSMFHEYMVQ